MNIIAIFGETVEFSRGKGKEVEYMEMDEFVETFGMEALTDAEGEEMEEGTLYRF